MPLRHCNENHNVNGDKDVDNGQSTPPSLHTHDAKLSTFNDAHSKYTDRPKACKMNTTNTNTTSRPPLLD